MSSKKFFLFIAFAFGVHLQAATIDIVANFNPKDLPVSFARLERHFHVRYFGPEYVNNLHQHVYDPEIKKIIFFNCLLDVKLAGVIPTDKLVHFLWEPWNVSLEHYPVYARCYTWNDDLVDGKKIFRFNYPYLMPLQYLERFEDKKLCTMVTGRWHSHRFAMVKFFEKKPLGEFVFYGGPPPGYESHPMYGGIIPGGHSGQEKIQVLSKYRFCLAFENTVHKKGYITEKIFACFAAGCVPVYYGATNVDEYLPKDIFIDYRDFKDNEEMYQFLKNMPEDVYNKYLENAQKYLVSDHAKLFSAEHFENILWEAATF